MNLAGSAHLEALAPGRERLKRRGLPS